MKYRNQTIIVFLILLSGYITAKDSLFNKIKWFVPFDSLRFENIDTLTIDLKILGNFNGYVKINNLNPGDFYSKAILSIEKKPERNINSEYATTFYNAGIVEIDDHKDLLFWGYSGGNGMCPGKTNILYLYNPELDTQISLVIYYSSCPSLPLNLEWSSNADDPELKEERKFLEEIKYRFNYYDAAYLEKNKANIKFAYYYWLSKNNNIESGKLTIQHYITEEDPFGRGINKMISDSEYFNILKDEDKIYFSCYNAAVECYDKNKKVFRVLYVMNDGYDPILYLNKYKNYLLISTLSGYLALINLNTLEIRRNDEFHEDYTTPGKEGIYKLEVLADFILINEKHKINLPDF